MIKYVRDPSKEKKPVFIWSLSNKIYTKMKIVKWKSTSFNSFCLKYYNIYKYNIFHWKKILAKGNDCNNQWCTTRNDERMKNSQLRIAL